MLVSCTPFSPVIATLGPLQVGWYGLMYLLAFYCIEWWAWPQAQRLGFSQEKWQLLTQYVILGVLLGGRTGYMLFYVPNPWHSWRDWVAVWEGGMSFHGGLLGAALLAWIFCRQQSIPCWPVLDLIAQWAPVGLGLGRIGNFINGELWGRVSSVPWAVAFTLAGPELRHPSPLYEALGEGLLLFWLLRKIAERNPPPGRVTACFLLLYGSIRFALEYFREPDAHIGFLWVGLTWGQYLCIPMILLGLGLLLRLQPTTEHKTVKYYRGQS